MHPATCKSHLEFQWVPQHSRRRALCFRKTVTSPCAAHGNAEASAGVLSPIIINYFPSSLPAAGPDFSRTILKRVTLVKVGGDAVIECKPEAAPKPTYTWKKGRDMLRESERYSLETFLIFD